MADPEPTTRAALYDRLNVTKVADLVTPNPDGGWYSTRKAAVQRERNGDGSGSVAIRHDHAAAADVAAPALRAWVRVGEMVDGVTEWRGAFSVDKVTDLLQADGEEAEEGYELSGSGPLGRLGDALVLPWNAPGLRPQTTTRVHNFASPPGAAWTGVPTSRFPDPVYVQARNVAPWNNRPVAYLDPYAEWIWGLPSASAHPAGDCYFIRDFYLSAASLFVVYGSGDDAPEWWIDGVRCLDPNSDVDAIDNWQWTWKSPLVLTAGWHRFAVKGTNVAFPGTIASGPAGVLASGWTCSEDGGIGNLVFITGANIANPAIGTWYCASYPTTPPGMTVGEILLSWLYEAQLRGALDEWTGSFTESVDSDGVPWPVVPEYAVTVPRPMRECAQGLIDTWCDLDGRAHDGGVILDAFNKGGAGGTSAAVPTFRSMSRTWEA